MSVIGIDGTGAIVVEPDWEILFSDVLEIAAAREHWRIVTTELKDRQLLAAGNGHSIQRLVCAYLMFDRMYREVAENGAVSKPQYPDLSYETRVKFAAVTGGTIAEAVYRSYTAGEPDAFASMTEYAGAGSARYAYVPVNTSGRKLDTKCRFFNDDDDGSYYSPLLTIDPMTIDNSAPPAPTLNVVMGQVGTSSTVKFDVTAVSFAMNTASMRLESSHAATITGNGRLEQGLAMSFDVTPATSTDTLVTITAYAYSSNGTASPAAIWTHILPRTGGS